MLSDFCHRFIHNHTKKKGGKMRNRLLALVALVLLVLGAGACSGVGGKSSAVEGKLMDWNGKPVAGVKITAAQVSPIKGYEQFEAVTSSDGSFKIKGLFPSSAYVLKPWSDKWNCKTEIKLDSAPQGETAVLPEAMKIPQAFAKDGGSQVFDLASGKAYFTDTDTGLEWVIGPDQDTNYAQAEQWVAACKVEGGGWRMPTRAELKTLYRSGVGERNMKKPITTSGWWVWAEPKDSSSAWGFNFSNGNEVWDYRDDSDDDRVFGVRSRPR